LGLPRARRLRRPAEFDTARRGRYRARDSYFTVNACARGGGARLGIAVSRRVSSKAAIRNRIKRQIRESFRLHQAMLEGFDIVVTAQPPAAAAANTALAGSLRTHWKRLANRCNNC
jgi:ribonuclease P protein component